MNLNSSIKSINKRISQIREYFGTDSIEYHRYKNLLFSQIPEEFREDVLTLGKTGSIAISRSRVAKETVEDYGLEERIEGIWTKMKTSKMFGTVRNNVQRYLNAEQMKEFNKNPTAFREDIQNWTEDLYTSEYGDFDLYDEIKDEIERETSVVNRSQDDVYLQELQTALGILRQKGRSGQDRYNEASRIFFRARFEHEQRVREWFTSQAKGEETVINDTDMSL